MDGVLEYADGIGSTLLDNTGAYSPEYHSLQSMPCL